MVNERKRQKGEVEGDEVKKTESDTIGSKTLCASQTCQHSASISKRVLLKSVKKAVSIVRYPKKKKKGLEVLRAIFKGSYLKFWQSREPNYYMSFV